MPWKQKFHKASSAYAPCHGNEKQKSMDTKTTNSNTYLTTPNLILNIKKYPKVDRLEYKQPALAVLQMYSLP